MADRCPARPAPGVFLCELDEIADPGSKGFQFEAEGQLWFGFLVRVAGRVNGYVDHCPHAGWLLSAVKDRFLTRDGRYIICSGHGALFRPQDGLCVAGPCEGSSLEPWPVEVRDDAVFVAQPSNV